VGFKFKIQKIHNIHMKNNMNQKLILNIKIDSESLLWTRHRTT